MYVKDQMTANPVCINEDVAISEAIDIMANNDFHRLPVVDENNHLVGLITEGIISENSAGSATSLSIFELNYLLSKMKVKDIMVKNVETIDPDALLEKAAYKMRLKNIGCLVVMENDVVSGIITHNDIFDAFINLLGYGHGGTRYVLNIPEDKTGVLADVSALFAANGASISNLAVYHNKRGIEVVIIADCDSMSDALSENGYNVVNVVKN